MVLQLLIPIQRHCSQSGSFMSGLFKTSFDATEMLSYLFHILKDVLELAALVISETANEKLPKFSEKNLTLVNQPRTQKIHAHKLLQN